MISTHDFLNPRGERLPHPVYDLAVADPLDHNSAEDIWNEFIKNNSQIFMVLSGHQIGQALRTDKNEAGYNVYQILSDYQGRGMAANPPMDGTRITGIGDGWLRLMEFDTGLDVPIIKVRTYSTYYEKYSIEFENYIAWYKKLEQPNMTEQEFMDADEKHSFALALLDLDGFKPVNDRYGHGIGDELLCAIAERLTQIAGDDAHVARVGGDEFAIMLPHGSNVAHGDLNDLLLTELVTPFRLQGNVIPIGASVGMAVWPHDGLTIKSLMEKADRSLYAVKNKRKQEVAAAVAAE